MRKILLLVCLSLLSANVYADEFNIYQEKLKKCNAVFKVEAGKARTTADQRKSGYNVEDCYTNIGYEVIDKYYSKNSEKMKEKLTDFIKSSYGITSYVHQRHDDCTPTCGSMGTVLYIGITAGFVEDMVKEIIHGAKDYKL